MISYNIYKLTNKINNKTYFGIENTATSINIDIEEKPLSLLIDIIKYGNSNFTKEIVSLDVSLDVVDELIKQYISINNSFYNNTVMELNDHYTKHGDTKSVSKSYSFVYATRYKNLIYIGSHTTNNLSDGYLGSSRPLLKMIDEIGKSNFKREIIQIYKNMEDAKYYERNIIEYLINDIPELILNRNVVGAGGDYGDEFRSKISEYKKKQWSENYDYMKEKIHNPTSNQLRGDAQSEWIKNNPEAHQERMLKINKNPEKIAKMAEKHRGMKRSEDTCINISEAKKAAFANKSDEQIAATVGRGMVYVTDLITYKAKRVPSDYQLKENESFGVIKNPKEPLKKRAVVTNIDTWEEYWRDAGYVLNDNERKGNKKVVKKKYDL